MNWKSLKPIVYTSCLAIAVLIAAVWWGQGSPKVTIAAVLFSFILVFAAIAWATLLNATDDPAE